MIIGAFPEVTGHDMPDNRLLAEGGKAIGNIYN